MKMEPHQKCSSRNPPVRGPSATPTLAVAAHTPMAFGRLWAGKTFVMIDSVAGMISAPPMPKGRPVSEGLNPLIRRTGERREQ